MIMFGSFLPSLGRCHYQVYSGRGNRRFYEITGVHGVGGRSSTLKPSGAVGVWGDSRNSAGVFGSSNGAEGVHGQSSLSTGVTGQTAAANQSGVVGMHSPSTGFGVGTVGATLSSDPGAVGVGGIAAN